MESHAGETINATDVAAASVASYNIMKSEGGDGSWVKFQGG